MDKKIEWQKFFEEFGELLNRYHFYISDFVLSHLSDDNIKLISFNSDGERVYPVYYIPNPKK